MSDWLCARKVIIFADSQKAAGKCEQCQYPWNDGLCACGKSGALEERAAKEFYEDYRAAAIKEQDAALKREPCEGLLSVDELSKLWEIK